MELLYEQVMREFFHTSRRTGLLLSDKVGGLDYTPNILSEIEQTFELFTNFILVIFV